MGICPALLDNLVNNKLLTFFVTASSACSFEIESLSLHTSSRTVLSLSFNLLCSNRTIDIRSFLHSLSTLFGLNFAGIKYRRFCVYRPNPRISAKFNMVSSLLEKLEKVDKRPFFWKKLEIICKIWSLRWQNWNFFIVYLVYKICQKIIDFVRIKRIVLF